MSWVAKTVRTVGELRELLDLFRIPDDTLLVLDENLYTAHPRIVINYVEGTKRCFSIEIEEGEERDEVPFGQA